MVSSESSKLHTAENGHSDQESECRREGSLTINESNSYKGADSAVPDIVPDNDKSQSSGRDHRGRWAAENDGALRHGARRYELRGVLPDEVQTAVDAWSHQLTSDRGGTSEMGAIESAYCRRLTQLEGALDLLGRDLHQHGVMTPRGRPRAAYKCFLETLATFDRLAQRLGLDRKAKRVDLARALSGLDR
jgi:hypothetical protein